MNESTPALYDVWRIAFEYEDQPGVTKERPVIIGAIDEEFALVLVVKVTSHASQPDFPGEVLLEDWKDAGLDKPSVARCSKTLLIPRSYLAGCYRYVQLSSGDSSKIAASLQSLGMTF